MVDLVRPGRRGHSARKTRRKEDRPATITICPVVRVRSSCVGPLFRPNNLDAGARDPAFTAWSRRLTFIQLPRVKHGSGKEVARRRAHLLTGSLAGYSHPPKFW